MAELHNSEIATKLHQLRIMNFLVRELSLEFDVQQFSHFPPGMAAAAATMMSAPMADVPDTPKPSESAARSAPAQASLHGRVVTQNSLLFAQHPKTYCLLTEQCDSSSDLRGGIARVG